MWGELIYAGILVGNWAYHRWEEYRNPPKKPKPADRITVPRTDEGAPVPLIYGRCRVRAPILAWCGTPDSRLITADFSDAFFATMWGLGFRYHMPMFFKLGIGFESATNFLHNIYLGDRQLIAMASPHDFVPATQVGPASLTGEGENEYLTRTCWLGTPAFEDVDGANRADETNSWFDGQIEFLNGRFDQRLVDGAGSAVTRAAVDMIADGVSPSLIPGYRGFMCVHMYAPEPDGGSTLGSPGGWVVGPEPTLPVLSFEASSFIEGTGLGGAAQIDSGGGLSEANPVDVLYDLCTGRRGKLNIPFSSIHLESWTACAVTLNEEGHGYSRAVEDVSSARELIGEILEQIDATFYEDPSTGKLGLKLIRFDYNLLDLFEITPDNCERLENVGSSGIDNATTNAIRIIFEDRQSRYRDNSITAQNQANAVGQSNQINSLDITMRGIKCRELANTVGKRELRFRSRSLRKARAIVDRSFVRATNGSVVKVSWPEFQWSKVLFRVADAGRGTLEDGRIALTLLEEPAFEHRGEVVPGDIAPFPVLIAE